MQTTSISSEEVVEVAENVFNTMLSLSAHSVSSVPTALGSFEVAGMIHITGAWNGTILLLCDEQFARHAACTMLDVPAEQATMADIHDAVAELSNIIGGGINGLLPSPSALSLPTVTQGSDFHMHVHWTQQVARGDLECEGNRIQIRVLEGTGDLKDIDSKSN